MQRTTSQQEDPRKVGASCRNVVRACLLLGVGCLLSAGCGGQNGVYTEVIHGTVTVGGQTTETGRLRFVPIEGTLGPASTEQIVDGQYRIEARGGVPVGKHRVEVTALKKTRRKVIGRGPGGEPMQVDETINLAPEQFAGAESPLTVEVIVGSDGRIDIEIPPRSE